MEHELKSPSLKSKSRKDFNKLLVLYQEPLTGIIYKLTHDSDITEKLLIRINNKIYSSRGQYHDQIPFSTWLFRQATDQCIDYLRQKGSNFNGILKRKNNISHRKKTIKKLVA